MAKVFQIADDGRDWSEKGPDLYRKWDNEGQGDQSARPRLVDVIPKDHDLWWRKGKNAGGWTDWKGNEKGTGLDRSHVMERADDWAAAPDFDKQVFQVGHGEPGSMTVTAKAKAHLITVKSYSGATDRAEFTWALYDRRWPETTFAGIFVCKPYSHGYGDAVDISYGPTPKVFDWGLRMSKAKLLVCEQIIGTQDGKREVTAWKRDGFAVESYNGNGSHLWHVHHGNGHATDASPPCMD